MGNISKMIGYIIDGATAFCSLTGITIIEVIGKFNPTFLEYKNIFYIIIILGIILRYQRHVIPRYKMEIQDKPKEEAKGSCLISALVILVCSILIIIQCINLNDNSMDTLAQDIPNETSNSNDIINDEYAKKREKRENHENHENNTLTPLDKMIEEYILYSENAIIPMDQLESLSDIELYYIRNGILAYAGRAFESGYYDKYSWYSGNLSKEDVWSNINQFQLENIENIKSVERQRDECID